MKLKILVMLLCAPLFLAGCSGADDLPAFALETLEKMPFNVPAQFAYDDGATRKNEMLTYRSDGGVTLILSCKASSETQLRQRRQETVSERTLEQAYHKAGLEVTVSLLRKTETRDRLDYTYTVRMTDQYGTSLTRKLLRVTKRYRLDISCGGREEDEDRIDEDFAAVLQAAG